MKNSRLGRDYLARAMTRKEFSDVSFQKGSWPDVVRASQEIVELSLKAALRIVGVEPPKWHDVGQILANEQSKFPPWFQAELRFCSDVSSTLSEKRELSFYGDSNGDIPASEIFSQLDAEEAKEQADRILALCQRLLAQGTS